MSAPKRLVIEYEDSSKKEVNFSKLNSQTQFELSKLGVCPPPGGIGSSKHYILLRWKDGWQEVIGVDRDAVELLRYYVIRRIEDRGRLSVDVSADYPELFVIERTPIDLRSLLIVGDDAVKSYELESEVERWEGIFEAGGKKEYVKYDKTDPRYPHEFSKTSNILDEIMDSVKRVLDERNLNAQKLLAADQNQRVEEYKQVAKAIGIRGSEKQEDVYGFIELIVKKLAARKA